MEEYIYIDNTFFIESTGKSISIFKQYHHFIWYDDDDDDISLLNNVECAFIVFRFWPCIEFL